MALSDPDSTPACEESSGTPQDRPVGPSECPPPPPAVEAVREVEAEEEQPPSPSAEASPEAFSPHLPDGVVKQIAGYLVNESASLLNLLSMAGVCKSWRVVASELSTGVCLPY